MHHRADRDRDQALEMLGLVRPVGAQPDQLIPDPALGAEDMDDLGSGLAAQATDETEASVSEVVEPLEPEKAQIGENRTPTGLGGKQSSCVLDSVQVAPAVSQERAYTSCQVERQGMTVGWQDVYSASLPSQWVDLGSAPLADGTYVLRYEVDPLDQVDEDERDENHGAEMLFTVRAGVIEDRPGPPRCAIDGQTSGLAGQPVALVCSHFEREAGVAMYWDTWDPWNATISPVTTFAGNADAAATWFLPTWRLTPTPFRPSRTMVNVAGTSSRRSSMASNPPKREALQSARTTEQVARRIESGHPFCR